MYKLYYDTLPGNRVAHSYLRDNIPNYEIGHWSVTGHVHTFMSMLGIDYCWTDDINDPEAIVILEIDSAPCAVANSVIEYASRTYRRSIVMSVTEPPMRRLYFDLLQEKYPNVLFVANGDHTFKHNIKTFAGFPFFALRPISIASQLEIHHIPNCNQLTAGKNYIFNHLSRFWSPNKYHMHYTIRNHFRHPRAGALTSYLPLDHSEGNNNIRVKINLGDLQRLRMLHNFELDREPTVAELYPIEDYINRADPNHPDCYQREQISGDTHFDSNILRHPKHIYSDCHLSLVTEVPTGKLWFSDNTFTEYNYISEKTLQPILHGHIFLVNANNQFNTTYIRDSLGFEIFNEIFDYADIEQHSSQYMTSHNIINQLNRFDSGSISDNAKQIAEKIHHNRDLVINPNSKLRQQLTAAFVDILDRSRELDT